MANLGIGIIGAGNISSAYLRLAPLFKGLEVRAVADVNMEAAKRGPRSSTSRRSRSMTFWRTRTWMWSST
jgi:predicted homoserine dehydrogenase-like protein